MAAAGRPEPLIEARPSFTRGIFAGAIHDDLLFPYPKSLDRSNPGEAALIRRLAGELDRMHKSGLIDPAKIDEEETVGDDVIAEFGRVGMLGLTIPRKYGGLELSHTGYARIFEHLSTIDLDALVRYLKTLAQPVHAPTEVRIRPTGATR